MVFNLVKDLIQANILATIGVLIALSFLGSKLFQKVGIPQVVGFIVLGVVSGPSFLNLIPLELSNELIFISEIALGLIGFDIGSHLHFREIRKLGRSILLILLFESIGTFLIVSSGVYLITHSFYTAIIFGALSSATAPAATVDVLAEYDAKGPLTTTLLAVIGLDDAIARLLFSVTAVVGESFLSGGGMPPLLDMVKLPLIEICGSIGVGLGLGLLLDLIMRRMKSHHDAMAISFGFVFIGVGLSETLGFSLILTTMIMGIFLVNRDPFHTRHIRFTIEQAGPVVYVLFFSLVGARLQIRALPAMGWLGIGYILLRTFGKFSGAWLGGKIGGAAAVVRNNLGFGLFTQGGVAIGLALACSKRFCLLGTEGEALGTMRLSVITATTFVVEIFGPIFVKLAIRRAGEIGKAKSEADVWASEGVPE